MDPGVRRDDDLRVCSQPSLPLFQPTVKTENPFACRSVILTKVRIQRLSSFLSATKGHSLCLHRQAMQPVNPSFA
jgi:hypothetical protein